MTALTKEQKNSYGVQLTDLVAAKQRILAQAKGRDITRDEVSAVDEYNNLLKGICIGLDILFDRGHGETFAIICDITGAGSSWDFKSTGCYDRGLRASIDTYVLDNTYWTNGSPDFDR